MGTLNLSQVVDKAEPVEGLTLPMVAEFSSEFTSELTSELTSVINRAPFQRSNRVNIRLRENDICKLEELALSAGMSLQAFLAEIIHQYATDNLIDK